MDESELIDPLDILHVYAAAGTFVEARLARLRSTPEPDADELIACEGMSDVLFRGIVTATSCMTDEVTITGPGSPDATRMLS